MFTNMSEAKRKELVDHVCFVGAGYFPSVEAFTLGMQMDSRSCTDNIFSAKVLETVVARLAKQSRWVLVYFIVNDQNQRMRVSREDALWFLENKP